eukprot:3066185-Rhodomonas_salina.1
MAVMWKSRKMVETCRGGVDRGVWLMGLRRVGAVVEHVSTIGREWLERDVKSVGVCGGRVPGKTPTRAGLPLDSHPDHPSVLAQPGLS